MSNINYRKIYESYYGSIPKDSQGRTYEIHHIDGDRSNNTITNLLCVSIHDHYAIHYSQGDWWACYLIAQRMQIDPGLQRILARKHARARVEQGTHNFQDKNAARNREIRKVEDGTHHFLGGNLQRSLIDEGRHLFVTNNPVYKQISDGKNKFTDSQWQKDKAVKMMTAGNCALSKPEIREKAHQINKIKIAEGNHHTQVSHTCPHCQTVGKGPNMQRYHFDNCKGVRKKITGEKAYNISHTCPHCGKIGKGGTMFRHHFDNCKNRGS